MLQPYNIRVAHKPMFTLQRALTNVEDKEEPEDRLESVTSMTTSPNTTQKQATLSTGTLLGV